VYSIVDVAFFGLERRRPRWAQHNPMKCEQTGCQVARVPSTGYNCLVRGTLEMETHICQRRIKDFSPVLFTWSYGSMLLGSVECLAKSMSFPQARYAFRRARYTPGDRDFLHACFPPLEKRFSAPADGKQASVIGWTEPERVLFQH